MVYQMLQKDNFEEGRAVHLLTLAFRVNLKEVSGLTFPFFL